MTDVGKKREKNEDSLLVDGSLGLFIVADGMGGHLGGEFASRLAVKTIGEAIQQLTNDPEATVSSEHYFDRSKPGEHLRYAIRLASQNIYEEACRHVNLRGMGTTTVAMLVRNNTGFIGNVGDSRGYLIRDNKIEQVTADHSLVAEQLRAGVLTEEQTKNHKYKNIITRSVGFQSDVEIDVIACELKQGDRILLCSDGLTNLMEDADILKIIKKHPPREACRKLIDLANKRGGDDNVTVVIAAFESEEERLTGHPLTGT